LRRLEDAVRSYYRREAAEGLEHIPMEQLGAFLQTELEQVVKP
jgi:hypothetical protein